MAGMRIARWLLTLRLESLGLMRRCADEGL